MTFKFEQLRVWQESVELTGVISELTKSFPKEELFVLSSQIKRAADSVALNIAEGSTGQTTPEFKRFLSIANRSAIEVVTCLYIAKRRQIIKDEDFNKIYNQTEQLIKGIQALRNSLK